MDFDPGKIEYCISLLGEVERLIMDISNEMRELQSVGDKALEAIVPRDYEQAFVGLNDKISELKKNLKFEAEINVDVDDLTKKISDIEEKSVDLVEKLSKPTEISTTKKIKSADSQGADENNKANKISSKRIRTASFSSKKGKDESAYANDESKAERKAEVKNKLSNIKGNVISGAANLGQAAIDNADSLKKQSVETGVSTERLQELKYVSDSLDVSYDNLVANQGAISEAMISARGGAGAQADAFNTLGISLFDSSGKMRDSKDVMNEAMAALSGVGNESERNALALAIFGESAKNIGPILQEGGTKLASLSDEARRNGSVMSEEAVSGLDDFGESVDSLKNSATNAFGEILSNLAPSIQGIIDGLTKISGWINENPELATAIVAGIGAIVAVIEMFNIAQSIANFLAVIFGTTLQATLLPVTLIVLAIGALIAIGVLLFSNWDLIIAKAGEVWSNIVSIFSGIGAFFAAVFGMAFNAVVSVFSTIGSFFKGIWDSIVGIFTSIGGAIGEAISGIFRKAINGIIDLVEFKINFFIKAINLVLKLLNKIPGVELPQLKELNIPRLADGGILTKATLNIAGEAGPEAILPIEKIDSIIASAMNKAGLNGNTISLNFYPKRMTESELNIAFNYVNHRFGMGV